MALALVTMSGACYRGQRSAGPSDQNTVHESRGLDATPSPQEVVPLKNLVYPRGLAIPSDGTLYVTTQIQDRSNGKVVSSPAGSNNQSTLPFGDIALPTSSAVDGAGPLYLADYNRNRVLKLPNGSDRAVEVPLSGLSLPSGVAVDSTVAVDAPLGHLYVTDTGHRRVLKFPAGEDNPMTLPFSELWSPTGLAFDRQGNLYVADSANDRVLKLPAGSFR